MKKFLIILVLAICGISAKAQNIYDECITKVDVLLDKAHSVYFQGNITNGYTPEQQALYANYHIEASNTIDRYVAKATQTEDKVDLMWTQLRVLSEILFFENARTYNNISVSEYDKQVNKFITTADKLYSYSLSIGNKDEQNLEQAYIAQNLGYLYFHRKDYTNAHKQFSIVISKYNTLKYSSFLDKDEIRALGQCGYYELGYVAHKQGQYDTATKYYNQAKAILNDESIVPYK